MPFQPINFANIPVQRNTFLNDFLQNIKEGMDFSHYSEDRDRMREKERLANKFSEIRNTQSVDSFDNRQKQILSEALLKRSQADKINKDLQDPFYGINKTGEPGYSITRHQLEERFGAGSDIAKNYGNQIDQSNNQKNILNSYRQMLLGQGGKRFSTPLGKLEQEREEASNGYMPGSQGKIRLTPEQQKSVVDRYDLQILKQTTDPQTRSQVLQGSLIEQTIDRIDPDHLTVYGGVKGQALLKKDQLASAFGNTPERYSNYQKSLVNAQDLSKQVRKFNRDSISPKAREQYDKLVNPSTWVNNPKVAKEMYQSFINTVLQEEKTSKGALSSPGVYQNKKEQARPGVTKITPEQLKKVLNR